MTKEEYSDLLAAIAGGGDIVGMRAALERRQSEGNVIAAVTDNYWGFVFLGDAIYQFYLDTLREVSARLATATVTRMLELFTHWHLVSLSRYSAAFDLFARGYYFESATLARGLWETALTLAALKRQVVSLEDVFGESAQGEESSARQIFDRMRRIDSRIQRSLIWKNANLSQAAREAVETFLGLVNMATHKSKLALTLNLRLAQQGQPIPILPCFDSKRTEGSGNILFLATWCLMATVPYLDSILPGPGTEWNGRYQKLLVAFEEGIKPAPSPVVQGFAELVSQVFIVA